MTTMFRDRGPIAGRTPNTDRPATPRPSAMQAPHETDPDWRDRGACLSEDPELFFPVGDTGPARLQTDTAKDVCRRCDVIGACLAWAQDTGQSFGIWGGLTEDERTSLKRKASRQRQRDARTGETA